MQTTGSTKNSLVIMTADVVKVSEMGATICAAWNIAPWHQLAEVKVRRLSQGMVLWVCSRGWRLAM